MNLANVPVELRPGQGWEHLGIKVDPSTDASGHGVEAESLAEVLHDLGGAAPVAVVLTALEAMSEAADPFGMKDVERVLFRALQTGGVPGSPFSFYRLPTG